MSKVVGYFRRLLTLDGGATMAEYGMMAALIAAVCLTGMTFMGTDIRGLIHRIMGAK